MRQADNKKHNIGNKKNNFVNKKNKSRKGKQSAIDLFIRGFIQSFFIVAILLGIGILTYQATMFFGKNSKQDVVVAYKEQPTPMPINAASVDDISKNLIYCYKEDTYEINKIVLEIFNCEKKQLTYITIPTRTQFTMSDSLYRKLILVHPEIPQMIKLSVISSYLDKDKLFDYGVLMVEDMLGIEISYYTAIPQDTFDTIFKEQYIIPEAGTPDGGTKVETEGEKKEQPVPVETFNEDYIEMISKLSTAEEVSTYIEEMYDTIQSNLTVMDKMNYLESYCDTPLENISFERIIGEDLNSSFVIDQEGATRRLTELTAKSNISE